MKTVLKTITLGSDGNPSVVICPGHVDAKTFNKAFVAEGWDADSYKQDVLKYVYCIEKHLKSGITKFKQVAPNVEGAKPYTWTSWD